MILIEAKTADGVDVELGETYYLNDGTPFKPTRMDANHLGSGKKLVMLWSRSAEKWVKPSDLYARRPEPDSWERLENDLCISACAYFDSADCDSCRAFEGASCEDVRAHEVVARAKKLAGVE